MRLRLIKDIPYEARHGTTIGREFEVLRRTSLRSVFIGDAGEECWAMVSEIMIVDASPIVPPAEPPP